MLAASMFQFNQPKVPCDTYICQEKGLEEFTPSLSTVFTFSILEVSPFLSFFSLIFISFFNEQGLFSRQEKTVF